MAITIKELLAADTISQAADKINFNFDQLLLNGGGPVGPPGPLGPPGPIGGRGIRGSQWFEGPTLPTILPNLEPNDWYLQGDISTAPVGDGDVYNFNGTAWIFTGINLTGPQGAMGISADWDVFGDPILTMGDCLYPNEALPPSKAALNDIRSALIGGIPSGKTGLLTDYVIPDTQAELMNSSDSSLYVHVPQGDQFTGGVASIKFSGGRAAEDYEQSMVSNLAAIRLLPDDLLSIEDSKISVSSQYGLRFYSQERSEIHTLGRGFLVQTGNYSGASGLAPSNGDITLQITKDPTGFNNSDITLEKIGGTNTASFKVGTTSSSAIGGMSGHIWSNADQIFNFGGTSITNNVGNSTINMFSTNINLTSNGGSVNTSASNVISNSTNTTSIAANGNLLLTSNSIVAGTGIKLDSDAIISLQAVGTIILETTGAGSGVGINTGLPATYAISPDLAVDSRVAIGPNSPTAGSMPGGGSLWVESSVGIGNSPTPPGAQSQGFPSNAIALTVVANSTTDSGTQKGAGYFLMDKTYSGVADTYGIKVDNYHQGDNQRFGMIIHLPAPSAPNSSYSYGISNTCHSNSDVVNYGYWGRNTNAGDGSSIYGISQTTVNSAPSITNAEAGHFVLSDTVLATGGGRRGIYANVHGAAAGGSNASYIGVQSIVTAIGNSGVNANFGFHCQVQNGSRNWGLYSIANMNYMSGSLNIGPGVSPSSVSNILRVGNGHDGYAAQIINTDTPTGYGGGLYINCLGMGAATNHYPLIVYADQYDNTGTYTFGGTLGHESLITCRTDGSVWLGGDNGAVPGPSGATAMSQVMMRFGPSWYQLRINTSTATTFNFHIVQGYPSDEKIKTNIVPVKEGTIDKIMNLNPITFDWNDEFKKQSIEENLPIIDDESTKEAKADYIRIKKDIEDVIDKGQIGFIAQEMSKEFPELITGKGDRLGIDYAKMVAVLTKGMQEQQQIIESLEARLQRLEDKL